MLKIDNSDENPILGGSYYPGQNTNKNIIEYFSTKINGQISPLELGILLNSIKNKSNISGFVKFWQVMKPNN